MLRRSAVLLGIVALGAAGPALAEERRADWLVVESYVAPRHEQADMLTAPVKGALAKRWSMLTEPEAFLACAKDPPAPHPTWPPDTASAIRAQIREGLGHFRDVRFADAIAVIEAAVGEAHRYPRLVAENAELRQLLFWAHITLALAYRRSGDISGSDAWTKETVRTFPDDPIPYDRFGPEPEQLKRRVLDRMEKERKARLTINTIDESAKIFVNERFVGSDGHVALDLYAGDYRVFATQGGRAGAVRTVSLGPGDSYGMTLDVVFDTTFAAEGHLGLVFPHYEALRRWELSYARNLAASCGKEGAVVLSATPTMVVGRVVSLEHGLVRQGYVEVAGKGEASVSHLYELAAYLAGDEPGPGVVVVSPDAILARAPATAARAATDPERFRFGAWKWVSLGVGTAAIATGGYLVHLDGEGTCDRMGIPGECPRLYDTRRGGIATIAVGSAAVVVGVAALIYDARNPRRRRADVAFAPAGGGAWTVTLTGSF